MKEKMNHVKRKRMICKRYHPHLNYESVNKRRIPFRILSVICFAGVITMVISGHSGTMIKWLILMGAAMLIEDINWFVQTMEGGYQLLDTGVCYWWHFKKLTVLYKDIKRIYVTNSSVNLPFILVIGGEDHGVLPYCMEEREKNGKILNTELESILVRNHETEGNYGFLWNNKGIQKLLEHYEGDYYIAESIISSYQQEYASICEQYGIREQVHIISG